MSNLKVFLSSTCYDLGIYRDELKLFIDSMGYKSTLSDYGDVLYDPREHTHVSCLNSVKDTDMLILIIGSRFGGKIIPEVLSELNTEQLILESTKSSLIENIENISITQAEVMIAIQLNIPIYVFVDDDVYKNHHFYKQNNNNENLSYPNIDKPETAKYIFEFIDYLGHRRRNNNLMKYTNITDIKNNLKQQWSKYFHKLLNEEKTNNMPNNIHGRIDDNIRKPILNKYKPDLYIPLKNNFCDLTTYMNCGTSVYPNVMVLGDVVEKVDFSNNGYHFNGKNMISVHSRDNLPCETEERTFIFALKPTQKPSQKPSHKPMFFFSYGQRKSHKCGDGVNNHDKSFGLFWGEPVPEKEDEEIPNDYKGQGIRIFFYCEKCKQDRNSSNCDTKPIIDITPNSWYIFAITYNAKNELKLYLNSKLIFNENYILKTSITPYLNLGGFVHHNENGAMIAKDLDYTTKGYIREFMMFKNRCLVENEIYDLTNKINNLIKINANKA